jgi:hypothetical protein
MSKTVIIRQGGTVTLVQRNRTVTLLSASGTPLSLSVRHDDFTARGDLLAGTGSGTYTQLPLPMVDGLVVVSDPSSSSPTGILYTALEDIPFQDPSLWSLPPGSTLGDALTFTATAIDNLYQQYGNEIPQLQSDVAQLQSDVSSILITTSTLSQDVADLQQDKVDKAAYVNEGDILVAGDAGAILNLPIGSQDHVLTVDLAIPGKVKWAAPGSSPGGGIPESILNAKGDLIVASANDTASILSVGIDGYVLTADSSTATGLTWAAPTSGSSNFPVFDWGGTPNTSGIDNGDNVVIGEGNDGDGTAFRAYVWGDNNYVIDSGASLIIGNYNSMDRFLFGGLLLGGNNIIQNVSTSLLVGDNHALNSTNPSIYNVMVGSGISSVGEVTESMLIGGNFNLFNTITQSYIHGNNPQLDTVANSIVFGSGIQHYSWIQGLNHSIVVGDTHRAEGANLSVFGSQAVVEGDFLNVEANLGVQRVRKVDSVSTNDDTPTEVGMSYKMLPQAVHMATVRVFATDGAGQVYGWNVEAMVETEVGPSVLFSVTTPFGSSSPPGGMDVEVVLYSLGPAYMTLQVTGEPATTYQWFVSWDILVNTTNA